ncbi:MAG: prolipoprotein diacylglyceryl transferase [Saprospiraceae bacterium]|nr:prolipoprotein diacylglyceryl transferase [Saprospiraceae bacterium]
MNHSGQTIGKILYALLFTVLLPVLLWVWASFASSQITLPAVYKPEAGWLVAGFGLFWIVWGMFSLYRYGKGLPMNAFPPEHYVQKGAYRWWSHPIYAGFGLLCGGASVALGSAAGLYLVTPVAVLGMTALVLGYENIDLGRRFPQSRTDAWLALPAATDEPPGPPLRVGQFLMLAAVIYLSNFIWANLQLTPESSGFSVHLAEPGGWYRPLLLTFSWTFAGILYAVVPSYRQLREVQTALYAAVILSFFLAVMLPVTAPAIVFPDVRGAFSLTVQPVVILVAAVYFSRLFYKFRVFFVGAGLVLALLISEFSPFPNEHKLGALAVFCVAIFLPSFWQNILILAEKIANSWREWEFGPVRVINHGFYVGVGAFLGILLVGHLVGKDYVWAILLFSVVGLVCSALWAQFIEGSEKLKRPFGYYGAVISVVFAGVLLKVLGYPVWMLIGAFSVAMPWVQSIGRLRCLINGCCHGGPCAAEDGIRYFHPRSRVCGLSHLKGESLYPTQVYSFIWMFFAGFFLWRLWTGGVPYPFIFGIYLILNGLGRFVEEAYRGEVQTPKFYGLRLYQWMAVLSVSTGMIMTTLKVERAPFTPEWSWQIVVSAGLIGLFTFLAMGVDFPRSNARFSRLV